MGWVLAFGVATERLVTLLQVTSGAPERVDRIENPDKIIRIDKCTGQEKRYRYLANLRYKQSNG